MLTPPPPFGGKAFSLGGWKCRGYMAKRGVRFVLEIAWHKRPTTMPAVEAWHFVAAGPPVRPPPPPLLTCQGEELIVRPALFLAPVACWFSLRPSSRFIKETEGRRGGISNFQGILSVFVRLDVQLPLLSGGYFLRHCRSHSAPLSFPTKNAPPTSCAHIYTNFRELAENFCATGKKIARSAEPTCVVQQITRGKEEEEDIWFC